jgi:hypothetical protein
MSQLPESRGRRWAASLARNDRFFSPRMLASIAAYLLLAASYLQARLTDDGPIYYDFMRRLVGEDVPAYAYQFGVVFWNLPFYVLSRLIRIGNDNDWVDHVLIGAVGVAVASTAAVLVLFYVAWRLIRSLGLAGGPGAILLTILGSPLFYYSIFQTGLKHAFDTLLVTLLAVLLLHLSVHPATRRLAIGIGLVAALLISVRYANIVLLTGVIYVFARRREFTQAYAASVTAVVGATCILALPLLLGIPYGLPPQSASAPEPGWIPPPQPALLAGSSDPVSVGGGVDNLSSFEIDFAAPLKMLFTVKRGLFVWTPLTFFGVVGYLLLLRRDRTHRTFLVGLGISAVSLLLVHIVWGGFWTGGFSFSQRFLTALFPVFVIGIAELLERSRMWVAPLLIACVAWTWFLALHHYYGYNLVSERDGADRIVELYRTDEETPRHFWDQRLAGPISRHWQAYWDWLDLSSERRPEEP